MSETVSEKLVIIATHGPEDPERASLPFVIANAALVMDVQVVVILQGTGVLLAQLNVYDRIFAAGLPSLENLMANFTEQGGVLLVCSPCVKERKIVDLLLPSVELVTAGRVVQECLEATNVLNY